MASKCVGLGVAPSVPVTLAEKLVRYEYDSGEKRFQEQYYNPFISSKNYKNFIIIIAYLSAKLLKTNLNLS